MSEVSVPFGFALETPVAPLSPTDVLALACLFLSLGLVMVAMAGCP